jgi:hypothetical protein
LAISFKLTGGVGALILGTALVLRICEDEASIKETIQPKMIVGGLVIGLCSIYIGFPSVLVGGPTELISRLMREFGHKATATNPTPIWYSILRGYLEGMGLPMFLAVAVGIAGSFRSRVISDNRTVPLYWLLALTVLIFLFAYSRWSIVRARHLVPTFPALYLILGAFTSRVLETDTDMFSQVARVGVAVLLISTVFIAAGAEYGYATEPRDQATEWLETNGDESAIIEVYKNSIANVPALHEGNISHYDYPEQEASNTSSLILNESSYTNWMIEMPERQPDYIVLTPGELDYQDSTAARSRRYPKRGEYIRSLLDGEYNYTVAKQFGEPRATHAPPVELLHAGLSPNVEGQVSTIVILERTDQATPNE